jgi:hypothetical protein
MGSKVALPDAILVAPFALVGRTVLVEAICTRINTLPMCFVHIDEGVAACVAVKIGLCSE